MDMALQRCAPVRSGTRTTSLPMSRTRSVAVISNVYQTQVLTNSHRAGLRRLQASTSYRRINRTATSVEANLFSRIWRIVAGWADSVVSSAEDPDKILDQAVAEMQEDLIKMRQATAQVMGAQKQLEAKYKNSQGVADDWLRRAQLAVEKGEDDLAREALKRRKAFQEQADQLKVQLQAQTQATEQLLANARLLESKLSEARMKKETLKARAASAQTSKEIMDMVSGIGTGSSAFAAFEKMEEKVIAMESEAQAAQMLSPAGDTLEQKFAALSASTVDDDLASLKKSMGSGPAPAAALPEGRPIRDAIDFELDELRRKTRA